MSRSVRVPGHLVDTTRPPAPDLEVTTDPAQQKATLNWPNPGRRRTGACLAPGYRLRTKGPAGPSTSNFSAGPVVVQNLQVDATYEFTLDATDACGDGRELDPPRAPQRHDAAERADRDRPGVRPGGAHRQPPWVASSDNIQVDHYEILRNGVPVGATDAPTFTDASPSQHAQLSYVVRAVDTNGNETDSAPAIGLHARLDGADGAGADGARQGATAVLRWTAATDNVGVVAYDVLRDGALVKTMTSAERTWSDAGAEGRGALLAGARARCRGPFGHLGGAAR